MNHEDCGAYGAEGNEETHRQDLLAAAQTVTSKYSALAVETYFVRLNGQVTPVN